VAITINIERILAYPHLPGRAAETVAIIGGALVIASLGLFPGQSPWGYGLEATIVGLVVAGVGMRQFWLAGRDRGKMPAVWRFVPLAMVTISALPMVVGGLLLVAGNDTGLYWIRAGIVLSFVATLENGWVLLIEILR
jgi:modulator of FtsH protease